MATTIAVSEETRDLLLDMKTRAGAKSMDDLLRQLAIEHKKQRLREASDLLRKRMKERGLTIRDLR